MLYYKPIDFNPGIFHNCLAVVGSRVISKQSQLIMNNIFKTLKDITIVSGFMSGVDTYAHQLALYYKLPTIAVLPCGIDRVVPAQNIDLYKNLIGSKNLILSEYPNYTYPKKWMFLKRDELIVDISNAVLVIEARPNSGTVFTSTYAAVVNKPIFIPRYSPNIPKEIVAIAPISIESGEHLMQLLSAL